MVRFFYENIWLFLISLNTAIHVSVTQIRINQISGMSVIKQGILSVCFFKFYSILKVIVIL